MFNALIFYRLPRPSTLKYWYYKCQSVQNDPATFRLALDRLDENGDPTGKCHHRHLATVRV